MILLDEITEKICHYNASKYPISQFTYLNMIKKKLDKIEVHIAENLDFFNQTIKGGGGGGGGVIIIDDEKKMQAKKKFKKQKIDISTRPTEADITNKAFERLRDAFKDFSNKMNNEQQQQLEKEANTLKLLQMYQDKIKNVNTDFPFKFIGGDFDQTVINKFQLNLDALYILVTVCRIWGKESNFASPPPPQSEINKSAAIDEKVSKIIANMNFYLTFLL